MIGLLAGVPWHLKGNKLVFCTDKYALPYIGEIFCIELSRILFAPLRGSLRLQNDPEWTAEKELCMRKGQAYVAPKEGGAGIDDDEYQLEAASQLELGQRCEVDPGAKRGEIK